MGTEACAEGRSVPVSKLPGFRALVDKKREEEEGGRILESVALSSAALAMDPCSATAMESRLAKARAFACAVAIASGI